MAVTLVVIFTPHVRMQLKVLARLLAKLSQNQPHFALAEIRGGSIRNAIPREAAATICFNHDVESVKVRSKILKFY